MDSGNSGSMQSSSTCGGGGGGGGDEEYDSRAESISAFFNSNLTSHVGPMPNPPQQPSSSAASTCVYQDTLFTNFFDHPSLAKSPQSFNTNSNSFVNLDMVWSKSVLSDPNCTDLGNLMVSSSSTQPPPFRGTSFQAGQESVQRASVSTLNDQSNNNSNKNNSSVGVRNPRKRSRASRRAPTTVLTTDTNNFRAMVQEFTGIPAPPSTSTCFSKSRLDLFGTASSALRSASGHLDVSLSSPHLLRPFAQKVQQPYIPFVGSSSSTSSPSLFGSSMVGGIASTTVTTTTASNSNNHHHHSTSNTNSQLGYQMPSDLGLLKQLQSQNLFNINMQNPVLNFQAFLDQGPPRYPLSNTAILGSKQPQGTASHGIQSTDHSQLKMGTLEDQFGTSSHAQVHNNLGGLQNIVSSEGWPSSGGDRGLLRSINGNYSTGTSNQGVNASNNGNYGATSSDHVHGDKGPENGAPRSEGMVESWICSSD